MNIDEIAKIKRQNGKVIIVQGGAGFVSSLIKEGLIDKYHLFINPVVIGNGLTTYHTSEALRTISWV